MAPQGMDALELLEQDHRTVEQLFEQFQQSDDEAEKASIAAEIIFGLTLHAELEETIFYPAVRDSVSSSGEMVDHSLEEHQEVKQQLEELQEKDPGDPEFQDLLMMMMDDVQEHVQEEENEMFPKVREQMEQQRLEEMGRTMEQAKAKTAERLRSA